MPLVARAHLRDSAIRCSAAAAAPPPLFWPAGSARTDGLSAVFDGQDAVADAGPCSPSRLSARDAVVADGVVMRRLAPDDAAERDIAVIVGHALGHADGGRDFQRAGHLDDLGAGPGRCRDGLRAGDQVVGDVR